MEIFWPRQTVSLDDYSVEMAFTMVWMLFGVGFYSVVIGIISSFFTSKDTKKSLLLKKIKVVEDFCEGLNINEDLKENLVQSIKYSSDKLAYLWLSPEEDIFSDLSVNLKYEFLVAIHKDLILKCDFFREKDTSFVVRMVPKLRPAYIKAGEHLWTTYDDSSCSIFLIMKYSSF